MSPDSRKIREWEELIGRVPRGATKVEAEAILGPPSRTIARGEAEILSYRDEIIDGTLYGIRVAYTEGRITQCYLGFELTGNEPSNPSPIPGHERKVGVVALLMAAPVVYFGVGRPLLDANAGKTDIAVSLPVITITPALLFIALMLVVLGPATFRILGSNKKPSKYQLVLVVILAALGMGLYAWLRNYVSDQT